MAAKEPMLKAARRLRSNSGETIAEVLVGVLIVGLATVMFATMVAVATNTTLTSTSATKELYGQVTAVDSGSGASKASGTVTMTAIGISQSFSVSTYSSGDLTSYRLPAQQNEQGE